MQNTSKLYSIYDQITNSYMLPFTGVNDNEAMRLVRQAANDSNCSLSHSPSDYFLYHVATFNNETAEYTNVQPPSLIAKIQQLISNGYAVETEEK